MPYWRLHYHLVWGTSRRLPLITQPLEAIISQIVFAKARELRLILHAVGGVEDHLYVVASIPPTLNVASISRLETT